VDPGELRHIGVGLPVQRLDLLQLAEVSNLPTLQQDVAGEARDERDQEHDDEIRPIVGRQHVARSEDDVAQPDEPVRGEPARVRDRPPRHDERDQTGQEEDVADGLEGQDR
jgi:hypothetical protein